MVKHEEQVPQVGDAVIIAREHTHAFSGVVTSINVEKSEVSVFGCLIYAGSKLSGDETKTFSLNSVESINGRYVMARLYHYQGWHPAAKTLIDVGTRRQLAKENQEQILWTSLHHMGRHAFSAHQRLIAVHANNARSALQELLNEGAFDMVAQMLPQIMEAVAANAAHQVESDDEFAAAMLPSYRIQSALLNADRVALKKMLSAETYAEYFGEDE